MIRGYLLDTGPLVAYLDQRDRYHDWAVAQLNQLAPPLWTCEAVLTETCYLLRSLPSGNTAVMAMLGQGLLQVSFRLQDEASAIAGLMGRYRDVPMALADACLVRMAEQFSNSKVVTLDHDFLIYRLPSRRLIPTLMPDFH